MRCNTCGAEVAPSSSFCGSCGARLSSPGLSAQSQQDYQPSFLTASAQMSRSYKGIGPRMVATILDTVMYFVFAWVVAAVTGGTTSEGFELQGAAAFLTFVAWAAYYVLLEAYLGGTIGKLILGMRVVDERGRAPGLRPAVTRNLLRIVDFLPFAYILGGLAVALSSEKQRVGDRVAGTYVVSR